jgi:hypothetical protein
MARITKNLLNEWWGDQGFREMERITGFRQSDFSPEDGYQDFVDACDEWWDKLPYAEKVSIYKNFNY